MKRLADVISAVFHPLFMPVIGMGFYMRYILFVKVNPALPVFILLVMAACTIVFPLITIFLMKSSKIISSIHMPSNKERKWPLLFGTFFFCLAYMIISQVTEKFSGMDGLKDIAIAGVATMMLCTLINLLYKLSIHMAGIGGVTGMMVAYAPQANVNMLYVIIVAVFIGGLVGFSRLKLNAHSSGQVALGYFIGFISQFVVISLSASSLIR